MLAQSPDSYIGTEAAVLEAKDRVLQIVNGRR